MNQLLASTFLSAVILAVVYLFMRVLSLDQQVRALKARAAPTPAPATGDIEAMLAQLAPPPSEPVIEDLAEADEAGVYGPSVECANASDARHCFRRIDIEEEDDEDEDIPPVSSFEEVSEPSPSPESHVVFEPPVDAPLGDAPPNPPVEPAALGEQPRKRRPKKSAAVN